MTSGRSLHSTATAVTLQDGANGASATRCWCKREEGSLLLSLSPGSQGIMIQGFWNQNKTTQNSSTQSSIMPLRFLVSFYAFMSQQHETEPSVVYTALYSASADCIAVLFTLIVLIACTILCCNSSKTLSGQAADTVITLICASVSVLQSAHCCCTNQWWSYSEDKVKQFLGCSYVFTVLLRSKLRHSLTLTL